MGLEVAGQELAAHHSLPSQPKDVAVDGGLVVGLGSSGFRAERQAYENFITSSGSFAMKKNNETVTKLRTGDEVILIAGKDIGKK